MFKSRIYELDALRGIAALLVVLFHYTVDLENATFVFNIGCVGVDLFFVISGFVILLTIGNTKDWKSFLVNRFSRLYPAYWICVSITTLSIIISYQTHLTDTIIPDFGLTYLANLSMLQFYLNFENIDGSYWTLIIELLFYGFIMLFLILNKKNYIETTGAVCLLIVFCYRFFAQAVFSNKIMFDFTNAIPILIYFPLFYSGILFYKLKFVQQTTIRWLLLLVSFLLQLYIFNTLYSNRGYLSFAEYAISLSVIYSLFIMYIFNKLNFVVNKATLWLGSISYVLYLLHKVIGTNLIMPLLSTKFGINFTLSLAITLCLVCLMAQCVVKYIEKPSMIYIRAIYQNKKQKN
jgi:peptidoglycan/LPS O-acetylase OafA/YrhL